MFGAKKVTLVDQGVEKSFTVIPLPARSAIKLLREILMLLSDTDLIHSVVLQTFIHKVAMTGVSVEGADNNEVNKFLQQDMPFIITHLIKSIMNGLDDQGLDNLIDKCMESVIYHNGVQNHGGLEAMQLNMIHEYKVIIDLMYEVLLINYGGAVQQIKKFLGQLFAAKTTNTVKE